MQAIEHERKGMFNASLQDIRNVIEMSENTGSCHRLVYNTRACKATRLRENIERRFLRRPTDLSRYKNDWTRHAVDLPPERASRNPPWILQSYAEPHDDDQDVERFNNPRETRMESASSSLQVALSASAQSSAGPIKTRVRPRRCCPP